MRIIFFILLLTTAMFAAPKNILFILLDDVGSDQFFTNTSGAYIAPMPNMQLLASRGMLFTQCRSNSVCSPSRYTLLTGRNSFRTGVFANDGVAMASNEYTIAEDLKARGYSTSLFGKWGLGGTDPRVSGGFNHFSGTLGLWPIDYYSYNKITNGVNVSVANKYLTTDTTDDAISWINAQQGNWFCYVAYNAAHWKSGTRYQWPPPELITQPNPGNDRTGYHRINDMPTARNAYLATIEAADTEIGRLLSYIDLNNTYVIITGDNGSDYVNSPNVKGIKGSDWDNSFRVPLIIAGPGIAAGSSSSYLLHFVDFYPTIMALANNWTTASPNTIDGIDFSGITRGEVIPKRNVFVAKGNKTTPTRMVTDGDFRLIDYPNSTSDIFCDLRVDPQENFPLDTNNLSGRALRAYNNLLFSLTTFTAKTEEQPIVKINYSQLSTTKGGIQVVLGGVKALKPVIGPAVITAPLKTGATDYTLWILDNPFGSWVKSSITEVIGTEVTFYDPSSIGQKEYRITNNAPEP